MSKKIYYLSHPHIKYGKKDPLDPYFSTIYEFIVFDEVLLSRYEGGIRSGRSECVTIPRENLAFSFDCPMPRSLARVLYKHLILSAFVPVGAAQFYSVPFSHHPLEHQMS